MIMPSGPALLTIKGHYTTLFYLPKKGKLVVFLHMLIFTHSFVQKIIDLISQTHENFEIVSPKNL